MMFGKLLFQLRSRCIRTKWRSFPYLPENAQNSNFSGSNQVKKKRNLQSFQSPGGLRNKRMRLSVVSIFLMGSTFLN